MNSVRDLFLDFQECRGGRNSEEGGGRGVGGWLVRLRTTTSSSLSEKQKFWPPKSGFDFDSTVETRRLVTARFLTRTTDLLMLGSFNLQSYTRNVDLFLRKASLCERYSKKVPHWLHGCLGLNRPTSFGPIWECRFSIVPSATHCMLTNTRTKQLALVVDTATGQLNWQFGNL